VIAASRFIQIQGKPPRENGKSKDQAFFLFSATGEFIYDPQKASIGSIDKTLKLSRK